MNGAEAKSRCHSASPPRCTKARQEQFVSIAAEGVLKEEANNHVITSGRWLDLNEMI